MWMEILTKIAEQARKAWWDGLDEVAQEYEEFPMDDGEVAEYHFIAIFGRFPQI